MYEGVVTWGVFQVEFADHCTHSVDGSVGVVMWASGVYEGVVAWGVFQVEFADQLTHCVGFMVEWDKRSNTDISIPRNEE